MTRYTIRIKKSHIGKHPLAMARVSALPPSQHWTKRYTLDRHRVCGDRAEIPHL